MSRVEVSRVEPGLAGWMGSADHKVIGRLWIATALASLVVGSIAGAQLGIERVNSGLQILTEGTFIQLHTLHGEVAVLLFLVPAFVGLATYLVPLQVGASAIAFPRGAATAYWVHLGSGLLLLGSYLAEGGAAGTSRTAVDLYLLALLGLVGATGLALVCVITTALCLRAPGMTLLRTPSFTWSIIVGGGLTLITAPVLGARLVELFVAHHFTGMTVPDGYGQITWFWSIPQIYLLAVPAAGIALEIVPVLTGRASRTHVGALVAVGAMGILGLGGWAQGGPARDDALFVLTGLAALLPALALFALVGDALRQGRPRLSAPLLMAVGAVVHLLLGALAGAVSVLSPLELGPTTWQVAVVHYSLYGGATLGILAALWYWAPKLWGTYLSEASGRATFALVFFGAILLSAPDLVNGLFADQTTQAATFDDDALVVVMNGLSLVGAALSALGLLVAYGALWGAAGRSRAIAGSEPAMVDDPWSGHTLEWTTTSPPPPFNFVVPPPPVTSPTPLLEEATTP